MIVIVMGVSGAGKSTVGRLLAARLGWEFHDGDDLHPEDNRRKMAAGVPLTDDDRWPWLERVREVIRACDDAGRHAVVACSALRAAYRSYLLRHCSAAHVVFLRGPRDIIFERVRHRTDHFMPADLLDSQFEALEEPQGVVIGDVTKSPEEIVEDILKELSLPG